jgi:hypothetical protein
MGRAEQRVELRNHDFPPLIVGSFAMVSFFYTRWVFLLLLPKIDNLHTDIY